MSWRQKKKACCCHLLLFVHVVNLSYDVSPLCCLSYSERIRECNKETQNTVAWTVTKKSLRLKHIWSLPLIGGSFSPWELRSLLSGFFTLWFAWSKLGYRFAQIQLLGRRQSVDRILTVEGLGPERHISLFPGPKLSHISMGSYWVEWRRDIPPIPMASRGEGEILLDMQYFLL